MLVSSSQELVENLFESEQSWAGVETNIALVFEEITRELEVYLVRESSDQDSTDGVSDHFSSIFDAVQEEFELISGDDDKKRFLQALSRIFALLLNTKVDTAEKIKIILKIAIETTLKVWSGPKSL